MTQSKDTNTKLEYDLILVGGSPSNLTMAHKLLEQMKSKPDQHLKIAIIEKSEEFGGHIVSGAVVNKSIFEKAYPNYIEEQMPIESVCKESHFSLVGSKNWFDVPNVLTRALASDFCKEGYLILTLSLVVKWMAETLVEKAKEVPNVKVDMFPGFPVNDILLESQDGVEMTARAAAQKEDLNIDGLKVTGVKVGRSGLDIEDNVYAKLVCFAEKQFVSKDLIKAFKIQNQAQLWSVGVKETWKLADDAPDLQGKVWHTMGYPALDGTFGGGFIYGLNNKRLTIGLVISLDSSNPNLHPVNQLQDYKKHPWLQEVLQGAELMHYGAAVLPEGGLASLPKQFQVNGAMLLGDALGTLDMRSLSGVDKAIESGCIAAEVALKAFELDSFSADALKPYQRKLMSSPYMDKMKDNKYFRKAFAENPHVLRDYLPKILNSIDNYKNPIPGFLSVGLEDPLNAIKSSLRLFSLLNNAADIKEEVIYSEGYTHINPDFNKSLMKRGRDIKEFDKKTVYSREDAVFYAHTKYVDHPDHIDEFSADTCLKCIKKYEDRALDVPCVSDCTAEVHRLDIASGIKVHGMSLENCVMCRTCELICPEQNLRVNAAYSGAGPDFMGL